MRYLSALCLLFFPLVYAATQPLVQVAANIGPNPNNVGMFVYKPAKLASPLPLIVAIHECTASATIYFESTQYANLADELGFMVVYPNSPRAGSCFDVNTPQTLTHNGGGDSQGIASMVTYSIATYGVDPSLVFVTGTSSGAMMTNVMVGSYPELFQAASVYSGVAFGCFAGPNAWNTQCAEGELIQTPQQWGQEVFNAFPGYTGSRPRMMLWHGTADETLLYPNFGEEIKQWTDVFGLSQTPTTTTLNSPQEGYTMTTYGSEVVGFSAAGVGHTVPVHETNDLAWFGISGTTSTGTGSGSGTGTGTGTGGTGSTGTAAEFSQCGGIGWTGPTACVSGTACTEINAYFSQCLPPA